jgi:hypothetical protein
MDQSAPWLAGRVPRARDGLFVTFLFLAAVPESTTFVGIPASAAAGGRVRAERLFAPLVCMYAQRYNSSASQFRPRRTNDGTSKLDAMRARAGVLRTRIRTQQEELQDLEQAIEKMTMRTQRIGSARVRASRGPFQSFTRTLDRSLTRGFASRWVRTFTDSVAMLRRKLGRVRDREGPNNAQWRSVGQYAVSQTVTATRIVGALVKEPRRLSQLLDPAVPSLIPHMPAILARLDKLETHVAEILEKVLNNRRHLAAIEPYLEGILERFDDIEPHLPWILKNIDVLGPYTGLLLKHIDELLLYARIDETEGAGSQYALVEQLLPHLEFYVSRLDKIGPHLPLIRPHIEKLLKHDRIAKISPHVDKFLDNNRLSLTTSANIDILLFYFGWVFRVPVIPSLLFAIPGFVRLLGFLANRLPKRFVRGPCADVACEVDFDYGTDWNKLRKGPGSGEKLWYI